MLLTTDTDLTGAVLHAKSSGLKVCLFCNPQIDWSLCFHIAFFFCSLDYDYCFTGVKFSISVIEVVH